jgi:hypothetical protein
MNDFPNDFQKIAKTGDQAKPISSYALMQNFVWGKLIVEDSLLENVTSMGFSARKLKIPSVPGGGTFVLGAVNGSLTWVETEEC